MSWPSNQKPPRIAADEVNCLGLYNDEAKKNNNNFIKHNK
jgi:hypothetical protein